MVGIKKSSLLTLLVVALSLYCCSSAKTKSKKSSSKKVDIDLRQEQQQSFGETTKDQTKIACDPSLPNLIVGDVNLTDKNIDAFKKQNPVFIIGMSDSTCDLCCTTEPLLKELHDLFLSGQHTYKVRIHKVPIHINRNKQLRLQELI